MDSAQAGAVSYSEKKVWGKLGNYVIFFACSITFTKCKGHITYFNQSMFFSEIVHYHFVIIIILCNYFIIILRYVIMQNIALELGCLNLIHTSVIILDGNADKEELENMRSLTMIVY